MVAAQPAGGDLEHGLADVLRGQHRRHRLHERIDVNTLPPGVGLHRRQSEVGVRRQLR